MKSVHPSLDVDLFKEAMSGFATGVAVIAAFEDGCPVGFTCQSLVSLSLEPPLIALAPAKSSTSWPRMVAAGRFSVNVLSRRQEQVARTLARSGGDKFGDVPWTIGLAGTPKLDGTLAWAECELEMVHEAGDHELVIGRVLGVGVNRGDPLLFFRGGFATLA